MNNYNNNDIPKKTKSQEKNKQSDQTVGKEAMDAIPHMLLWFRAILMYPLSPQPAPQEFLTIQ